MHRLIHSTPVLHVRLFCCCCQPTEAQEFKKGFEAAAEANSALINAAAVPVAAGDGTAEAADQLADELGGKAKMDDGAAAAEPAAKEEAA